MARHGRISPPALSGVRHQGRNGPLVLLDLDVKSTSRGHANAEPEPKAWATGSVVEDVKLLPTREEAFSVDFLAPELSIIYIIETL
jgi:hypothetical protein